MPIKHLVRKFWGGKPPEFVNKLLNWYCLLIFVHKKFTKLEISLTTLGSKMLPKRLRICQLLLDHTIKVLGLGDRFGWMDTDWLTWFC